MKVNCTTLGVRKSYHNKVLVVKDLRSTSHHLSPVRLILQATQQHFGLIGAVQTRLHRLLQHQVHRLGSEVIWQPLHLLTVQVRAAVPVLIHVHAH